jgi:hypothetical protein
VAVASPVQIVTAKDVLARVARNERKKSPKFLSLPEEMDFSPKYPLWSKEFFSLPC